MLVAVPISTVSMTSPGNLQGSLAQSLKVHSRKHYHPHSSSMETKRHAEINHFGQEPEINGTTPNGQGYEGTWSQGQDIATLVHTVMVLDAEARP